MKRIGFALALTFLIPALSAHADDKSPAPATSDGEKHAVATCRDGKVAYSASNEHRGKCRGHGGVASWADGSPVKSHNGPTTEYR